MSKTKVIYIPAEPVSREEILRQIETYRINMCKRQLQRIKHSDLSDDQKRIQSSFIRSRLKSIEREKEREY